MNAELLTAPEVAVKLRLSRTTVYRLLKSQDLPSVRIGGQYRVPAEALERRLEPGCLGSQEPQPAA